MMLSLAGDLFVEKAYWLGRKRASMKMAENASCSAARLSHYHLAGCYSLNALAADTQFVALAESLPPAIYASGPNPSLEEADDG